MRYAQLLVLAVFLAGCSMLGAGTLGSFQQWSFSISEKRLDKEIANLYKNNPSYIIPDKWKELDTWNKSGYGFLKGKIFYFKDIPEQMYYISYHEIEANSYGNDSDSTVSTIAVRAVNSGDELIINKEDTIWISNRWDTRDDFDERVANNIDKRFYKEIISRLERQIGQRARKYND